MCELFRQFQGLWFQESLTYMNSLWLTHRTFGAKTPVFFCTSGGGYSALISSSRVVGPAGYWYLLMRFVSSTRTLYTRPFLKFFQFSLKRTHVSHLWKWIVLGRRFWASVFWGQTNQKSNIFTGILARFGKGTMVGGYGPSYTHLSLQTL